MRFAAPALVVLGAGIQAIAPSTAGATPVAVAFEGTFTHQAGAPAALPFGGILFYDSDVPNTSPPPSDTGLPPTVLYRFPPGSAGIRIDLPDATVSSHPASADVAVSSTSIFVDANGDPVVSPLDPDAVMRASLLYWTSFGANLPAEVRHVQLSQLVLQELPLLPDSAAAFAAMILGASVEVGGDGALALSGRIESATPIPEPSSAALLGLGAALLAAAQRTTRRITWKSSAFSSPDSSPRITARASAARIEKQWPS